MSLNAILEQLIAEGAQTSSKTVRQKRGHRPQRTFAPLHCQKCGKLLVRKRWGDKLEGATQFERRKYCDRTCANAHLNPRRDSPVRKPQPAQQPRQLDLTTGFTPATPQNASHRVNRPLPDPRKTRTDANSGTEASTMYRLKSKEGVPLLLSEERASGVTLPRPNKGELRAALTRVLRLHAPDLLEAWPGYEAERLERRAA